MKNFSHVICCWGRSTTIAACTCWRADSLFDVNFRVPFGSQKHAVCIALCAAGRPSYRHIVDSYWDTWRDLENLILSEFCINISDSQNSICHFWYIQIPMAQSINLNIKTKSIRKNIHIWFAQWNCFIHSYLNVMLPAGVSWKPVCCHKSWHFT